MSGRKTGGAARLLSLFLGLLAFSTTLGIILHSPLRDLGSQFEKHLQVGMVMNGEWSRQVVTYMPKLTAKLHGVRFVSKSW
jgi:hypothetical protein